MKLTCFDIAVAICDLNGDVGRECGAGEVGEPQSLYFFNSTSFFCEPLNFLGCGGNDNQFTTLDSCDFFCIMQGDARPSIRDVAWH